MYSIVHINLTALILLKSLLAKKNVKIKHIVQGENPLQHCMTVFYMRNIDNLLFDKLLEHLRCKFKKYTYIVPNRYTVPILSLIIYLSGEIIT